MTLLEAKEIDRESILQIKSKIKELGIGVPIVAEKEEEIICKKEALLNNPDGLQEGRYVYRISMEAYPRRCQAFVAYEVKDGEFIFKNKIIAEDRTQYPFSKEGLNKLLGTNKMFKGGQLEVSNERKQNPPTDFYGNEIKVGDEVKNIKFWSGPYIITRIEDGNYNGEPNNYKIWTKLKDGESDTERFTYSHYVEKVEPEIKIKPLEIFGQVSVRDRNGKEIHKGDEVREVGGWKRGIVRHIGPLRRADGTISGHETSIWSNWGGEQTEGIGINGLTYMGRMELEVVEPPIPTIDPLTKFGATTPNNTKEYIQGKIIHTRNISSRGRYGKEYQTLREEVKKEEYVVGDTIDFYRNGVVMKGEIEGKEGEIYSIVTEDKRSIVPRIKIQGKMIRNAYQ